MVRSLVYVCSSSRMSSRIREYPQPIPSPRNHGTPGRQTPFRSVPDKDPGHEQPVHLQTRRASMHVARALLFHHDHLAESFSKYFTRSADSITTAYGIKGVSSAAVNSQGCGLSGKQAWDLGDQKVQAFVTRAAAASVSKSFLSSTCKEHLRETPGLLAQCKHITEHPG